MIELTDSQIGLIARKYQQIQTLQQRLDELQVDLGDAYVQLCAFLEVDPRDYALVPPDEARGCWRLMEKETENDGGED